MTGLLPVAMVLLALAAVLYPLWARRRDGTPPTGEGRLRVLEEGYRAALADLQDVELDREIGNLSDADYAALRDRYRRQAAALLQEISTEQEASNFAPPQQGALPESPSPSTGDGREGVFLGPARKGVHIFASAANTLHRSPPPQGARGFASPFPPSAFKARVGGPVLVGGGLAGLAVIAIAALYLNLVQQQAAQAPLAALPLRHAHAVVIDGQGQYWVGHHDGLLWSRDSRGWQGADLIGDVMALVTPPSGDRQLGLGHDLLVQSRDGGRTWARLAHDLPGTDVHGAQATEGGIYAYVMGFGVFHSRDGEHWERTGSEVAGGVAALAVLPGTPDLLFLASDGTVLRSPDGGRTWAAASGAGSLALSGAVRSIAADAGRGALYAATTDGLFRSTASGTQWTRLPFRGSPAAVGARGGMVAVVDDRGRFFLSGDGGATWPGAP